MRGECFFCDVKNLSPTFGKVRFDDHLELSIVGLVALLAHHSRIASFGVRQPHCRTSRTHDQARVMPLTRLDTRMLCVLVGRDNFSIHVSLISVATIPTESK